MGAGCSSDTEESENTDATTSTETTKRVVQLSWDPVSTQAVNSLMGGYIIYYSKTSGFSISDAEAYLVQNTNGHLTPNSAEIEFKEGTWYFRVGTYGRFGNTTYYGEPSSEKYIGVKTQ